MYLKDPSLLDRLRQAKGLTRTELAARVVKADGKQPSRQLISYYLDGHRRRATRAVAESLSAAVGADVDLLWADTHP